jgi:hypothetical protein
MITIGDGLRLASVENSLRLRDVLNRTSQWASVYQPLFMDFVAKPSSATNGIVTRVT